MPVDLYYTPPSAPCRAVIMTAKYINLPLNLKYLDLAGKEQLKPEFLKLNPQHCVPTMVDGDLSLWESRAVMQYLANQYAPDNDVYPKEPKKRAVVDRLQYFDIGTLYPAVGPWVYPQLLEGKPADPEKAKAVNDKLALLDSFLSANKYVAGDKITLADFSILSTVTTLNAFDFDYSAHTNVTRWINQLKADLPFYQETVDEPVKMLKDFAKIFAAKQAAGK